MFWNTYLNTNVSIFINNTGFSIVCESFSSVALVPYRHSLVVLNIVLMNHRPSSIQIRRKNYWVIFTPKVTYYLLFRHSFSLCASSSVIIKSFVLFWVNLPRCHKPPYYGKYLTCVETLTSITFFHLRPIERLCSKISWFLAICIKYDKHSRWDSVFQGY